MMVVLAFSGWVVRVVSSAQHVEFVQVDSITLTPTLSHWERELSLKIKNA
jgi:hypothetical protein